MTLPTILTQTVATLHEGTDPDGQHARGALLLAAHAALRYTAAYPDLDTGAAFTFASLAIHAALDELRDQHSDGYVLIPDVGSAAPGEAAELARCVADLVHRLADFYTTAAAGNVGPGWRRAAWTGVAYHLDRATGDIP
jgi:hypothetical protein